MTTKRPAGWFEALPLPWLMLLAVGIFELMLCADYHEQRWASVVVPLNLPPERDGEALVIQWNGLGYYAWLRSLLIDGDWDFDNEFDEHNPADYYVPPPSYRTPLGRRANQWSVGPACLWAVAVVPTHLLVRAFGGGPGSWAADGYSLPYQLAVAAASLAVSFVGLGFLYGICRTQARPSRAALAAALLTLGTTIVYYSAIEISLPHGLGTAVLAALVWYWLTTYGSLSPWRWLVVGVLVGAAALVRWQLATFLVLPACEALLAAWRRQRVAVGLALLAGAAAVLVFLPQVIAWRWVWGAWLVNPIQGVTYHWLAPSLWDVLCSQDRSLFYWTPLTLLACAGVMGCLIQPQRALETRPGPGQTSRKEPLWILAGAFVIQVYALAGMWGQGEHLAATGNFGGVFLARSYGFRDLTESLVALAPGLAWLLERECRWHFRPLTVLGWLLALWNVLVVSLYTRDLIPALEGVSPSVLLTQTGELTRNEPFLGDCPGISGCLL